MSSAIDDLAAPLIHKEDPSLSVQAASERVVGILRSDEWQRLNGVGGDPAHIRRKLDIIVGQGLPPLELLRSSKLAELGRIPTNEEGFTVDGRSVLPGPGAAPASSRGPVLVFVSHRWLRPASYEPDDAAGTKAKALLAFSRWYEAKYAAREVFFWIDRSCICWSERGLGISTLPLYVASCNEMLVYETADYHARAWCRLERALAFSFMFAGERPWVLPHGVTAIADGRAGMPQEPAEAEVLTDPLQGEVSVAVDVNHIAELLNVAQTCALSKLWGPLARTLTFGAPLVSMYRFRQE